MIFNFLNQVRRYSKRHPVILAFLYRANDARTHAYDLLGFYHKEKRSTLVYDLVWNVSLTWYVVDTNAY